MADLRLPLVIERLGLDLLAEVARRVSARRLRKLLHRLGDDSARRVVRRMATPSTCEISEPLADALQAWVLEQDTLTGHDQCLPRAAARLMLTTWFERLPESDRRAVQRFARDAFAQIHADRWYGAPDELRRCLAEVARRLVRDRLSRDPFLNAETQE